MCWVYVNEREKCFVVIAFKFSNDISPTYMNDASIPISSGYQIRILEMAVGESVSFLA